MEKLLKRFVSKMHSSGVLAPLFKKQGKKLFKKSIMHKTEILLELLKLDSDVALSLIDRYSERIDLESLVLGLVRLGDKNLLEKMSDITPLSKYEDSIIPVAAQLDEEHMDVLLDLGIIVSEVAWKVNELVDAQFEEGGKLLISLLEKKK